MAGQARNPNVVKRRIYFYRATLGRDERNQLITLDPSRHLGALDALRFDDASAYLDDGERITCSWVDQRGSAGRYRIADIRRDLLPRVETHGNLTDLPIGDGDGLAEEVHLGFYGNGVFASEFNFYGPRIGRVGNYLRNKSGLLGLEIQTLVRGNIVDELNKLRDIRLFNLRVAASAATELADSSASVAELLSGWNALGDVGVIEVVLRPVPYSRRPLGHRVREAIDALVGRSSTASAADVFKTAGLGPDGRVRGLDLLHDDLVIEKEIMRVPGTRALEPDSVYAAMDAAYDEVKSELDQFYGLGQPQ